MQQLGWWFSNSCGFVGFEQTTPFDFLICQQLLRTKRLGLPAGSPEPHFAGATSKAQREVLSQAGCSRERNKSIHKMLWPLGEVQRSLLLLSNETSADAEDLQILIEPMGCYLDNPGCSMLLCFQQEIEHIKIQGPTTRRHKV